MYTWKRAYYIYHKDIRIRFKTEHKESNTKCCVAEMHQWWEIRLFHIEWKFIHYFACGLETPIDRSTKPSTCMNHGFDGTLTQNPFIISGENNCLAIQVCSFRFPTRNQGVLSSCCKSLCKGFSEIYKIFQKR